MKSSTERPYFWVFILLALIGLAADQGSKYVVFSWLYPAENQRETAYQLIPDYFSLRTIYSFNVDPGDGALSRLRTLSGERLPEVNRGALFGIGNGDSESGGMNWFFASLSILAASFIVFWGSRPAVAKDRFLSPALGLILAGTLGNFYDRIVFGGVRDFLHCYYGTNVWPDFNVADCCLVCGAISLLVHSIFVADPTAKESATPSSEAPSAAVEQMPAASPTSGV